MFSDKSEDYVTPSGALLEYEDPSPFVDPSDPPLDLDEPAFMDLFTETESFRDTENMVCDYLLPTAHLTNGIGYSYCDFRVSC